MTFSKTGSTFLNYLVQIVDDRGCDYDMGSISLEDNPQECIQIPNAFTPNNDGVNDTWQIKGISDMFQSKTQVYIYDRFGKLLRVLINADDAWNGTNKGAKMPSSDYWFSVQLEDGRAFTGHFTLKR